MKKINSYEVSEKVSLKFQEITGINFDALSAKELKPVKSASFDKFSVTDDINLRLLTLQGFKPDSSVKLISKKKFNGTGKQIFLCMVKDQTIKSFYQCYGVENTPEKAPEKKTGIFSKKPQSPKNAVSLFSEKTDNQIKTSTDVSQFIEEQKNFNKSILDILVELKSK